MLRRLLHRRITAFETTWSYRADYMREMLDAGGAWTLARFGLVASLGHGKAAPAEATAAARLVGTLAGDCGPCTQIGVDMALAAGVPDAVVRGILALTTAQMYPTVKYALGHGRACSRVLVAGVAAPFQSPEPVTR